jgi:hypothetical protein
VIRNTALALCAALCLCAGRVNGDIIPIGPFDGEYSDDFGSYPFSAHATLDIFGGFATITRTNTAGSIKIEFSSQLGDDLVQHRSPDRMMGQLSELVWVFDEPVSHFGGWWENNSSFDHAVVDFYDANDNLLASLNANVPQDAQAWTWNGWQSTDVGIKKIVTNGNDVEFLNGFIWYEDIQAIAMIPEPGAMGVLIGCGLLLGRRGRRSTK